MSPGQDRALAELREIESISEGAFELLSVRPPEGKRSSVIAEIAMLRSDVPKSEGGIRLRDRERFLIYIRPGFPFEIPVVCTPHHRFAGHPHVQWMNQLCLYQSPGTEWCPGDGMFGVISRLDLWLGRAALNELDMEGAPLHPPVAYPTERVLVIPRKDTPQVEGIAWFGLVNLRVVSRDRVDIVGWTSVSSPDIRPTVGAAMLLSRPLSWEYPTKAKTLLDQLERNGVSRETARLVMAIAADINPEDTDLFVIVGAPMRGIRGSARLKQHLSAWLIRKEVVKGLRLLLNKYRPEEGLRAIGREVERLMEEWFDDDDVDVGWCAVREDRSEILVPRDSGTAMNVFRDRTVAIWGCGALGAPIAECVARAGARKIILRDKGIVAPGVLTRQPYVDDDLGRSKAHTLATRLMQIRPGGIAIEPKHGDVKSTVLDEEDWTEGADYVIDTTASMAVIEKLEARRRECGRQVPVVSLVVGHEALKGLVVVSGAQHSGGPIDVLRNTKIAACTKGYLGDYVDEFWPAEPRSEVFQPEPGCSEATFIGSAADSVALATTMLNLAAADLKTLTDSARTDSATAHFVAQAHASPPGRPLHVNFAFQPDVVIEDPQSGFQIRIAPEALAEMQAWVERSARRYGKQAETGGVLFGGRDNACGVLWVSEVVGAPPDSDSAKEHFICGIQGVAEVNEEKRHRTRGSVEYIGMWHTHPTSAPVPSGIDFLAMHKLVNAPENASPRHFLLILGDDGGPSLNLLSGCIFAKKDFEELETHGILERTIAISPVQSSPMRRTVSQPNDRYLALSDMHFGTPESSVNDSRFRGSLVNTTLLDNC